MHLIAKRKVVYADVVRGIIFEVAESEGKHLYLSMDNIKLHFLNPEAPTLRHTVITLEGLGYKRHAFTGLSKIPNSGLIKKNKETIVENIEKFAIRVNSELSKQGIKAEIQPKKVPYVHNKWVEEKGSDELSMYRTFILQMEDEHKDTVMPLLMNIYHELLQKYPSFRVGNIVAIADYTLELQLGLVIIKA